MNPMKSYLNLRFLPSTGSLIASARQTQTILLATLALCVAIYAATPAYGSSSKASADAAGKNQTVHYGTMAPDGQTDLSGFNPDISGVHSDTTFTYNDLHPGVTYRLYDLVLYNGACKELTPGSWAGTLPTYGVVTQGYVYGHLSNGDCPSKTFKFRAIYYRWSHDINARHDHFYAHWYGDGYKTSTIEFKENLKP
jgi:hypothetical protein